MSNPIALSDLYFNWSLLPAASIVSRVKGTGCVVSSAVSFSNYRPCLERYKVSPNSFLSLDAITKTAVKEISSQALPRQIAAA